MKSITQSFTARTILGAASLLIGTIATTAQMAPALTIKPVGTNQFFISFTNNIGTASYDLQGTPLLANPDYPWTWAVIGTPGQTNFVVSSVYNTGFYRAILDTNSIPLWESADPNNPGLGALNITIDTPVNGSTLH